MTTLTDPPVEPALDVRTFLLGDGGPELLKGRLRDAAELTRASREDLSDAARRVVDDGLADAAATFLDVDLGATAVAGWRLHEQLRTAAAETLATPGSSQVVELYDHSMTTTWRPHVDLVAGRATLARVSFLLEVVFTVVGLHATVTGGRLVRLGGGSGEVRASFSCGGASIAERTAPFDARLSVPLGSGIALLGPAEPAATPSVVESAVADAGR
jgi:hypothetical protein